MNKKCVFTIVAKNYIGLAQILEKSIKRFDSDIDFYIFVSDEFNTEFNQQLPNNLLISKDILGFNEDKWEDMSFKYDLTAFCTAIKPSCFKYLFGKGYLQIIYFDPDIYVFSSLKIIYLLLENHSIVLTPHVAGLHKIYEGELPEKTILWHGIYNLGFCGLSYSEKTLQMLDWWEERLDNKCFAEKGFSYFYDQKWMSMLPAFFDSTVVHISQNIGLNLAPWNFFEREIVKNKEDYYVKFRTNDCAKRLDKLVFIHFAGYDYKDLLKGKVNRLRLPLKNTYTDIEPVLMEYIENLIDFQDILSEFINQKYSYNEFDNGILIDKFHRGLYKGLKENGINVSHPFSTGEHSLYALFKNHKMFDSSKSVDKYNINTYPSLSLKKKQINFFYKVLYSLLGYKRYVLFIKSLYLYSSPDSHIFLFNDKKYSNFQ